MLAVELPVMCYQQAWQKGACWCFSAAPAAFLQNSRLQQDIEGQTTLNLSDG